METHQLMFHLFQTNSHKDKAIVLTLQNIAKIVKMKYLTKLMFPFHLQYIYIVSYLNAHHHGYIMITVRHAWKWPGFKIQISQDTLHSVKLLLTSVGKVNLKFM